jgi:hypothetical protein
MCESAPEPTPSAHRPLLPLDDRLVAKADPAALTKKPRDLALRYIGSENDPHECFDRCFAPAAARLDHAEQVEQDRTWSRASAAGQPGRDE